MSAFYSEAWDYLDVVIFSVIAFTALYLGMTIF